MIDRTNVFDLFVENDLRTYDKFKKLQVVKGIMFVYEVISISKKVIS